MLATLQEGHQEPAFRPALGGWTITRYSDVASVLGDLRCVPTIIGSSTANTSPETKEVVSNRHAVMKRDLAQIMVALEQGMPMLLTSAAESLVLHHPCDLIQEILKPWCLRVAACVVGISPDPHTGRLAHDVFLSSAFPYDVELRRKAASAAVELSTQVESRNAVALQTFIALATSLPAFVGNAFAVLFSHSDQLRRLQEAPQLLPLAIEECLRLAGPACLQFRRASCDMQIGAAQIRRDQILLLMIQSANRDPLVFSNPESFDIGRTSNPHLAFGRGGHACVGANLIRSISRMVVVKVLSVFTTVKLIETPVWHGVAIRFVEHLDVVFE